MRNARPQAALDELGIVAHEDVRHEPELAARGHADEAVGKRERALGREPDRGLLRADRIHLVCDGPARKLVAERERQHLLAVCELVHARLVAVHGRLEQQLDLRRMAVVMPVGQDHRPGLPEALCERNEALGRRHGIEHDSLAHQHVRAHLGMDAVVAGLPVHDPGGDLPHDQPAPWV